MLFLYIFILSSLHLFKGFALEPTKGLLALLKPRQEVRSCT